MIYTISGDPIPLARARHVGGHVYDSQKHNKLVIGLQITKQHGELPILLGPLHMDITFFFPIPEKKRKKQPSLNGAAHVFKPDLSNLIKMIEDCCTDIIFKDDCQIYSISSKKVYDDNPRTEFKITELNNG